MAGLAPSPPSSCGLLSRGLPSQGRTRVLPLPRHHRQKQLCGNRVAASLEFRSVSHVLDVEHHGGQSASLLSVEADLLRGAQSVIDSDVSTQLLQSGPSLGPVSDASEAAGAVSPVLLAGGAAGVALVYGAVRTAAYFRLQVRSGPFACSGSAKGKCACRSFYCQSRIGERSCFAFLPEPSWPSPTGAWRFQAPSKSSGNSKGRCQEWQCNDNACTTLGLAFSTPLFLVRSTWWPAC